MILRIILSLAAIFGFGIASHIYNAGAQLTLGTAAVGQLDNSDAGFLYFTLINYLFGGGILPLISLLAILLAIWWKPLKNVYKEFLAVFLVIGLTAFFPSPSQAYYDQIDRAEFYEIGANQSAFLIPMVGANKDSQKQFGSVEYLNSNKVPAKRVQIPHVKADNTGAI
jgi:hypothetical protein